MSLYYFQPGKDVKQLLLSVKHCRPSQHAFDKTHILYPVCFHSAMKHENDVISTVG